MAYYSSGISVKTKNHNGHSSLDEVFDEENETDSKSDSDKVLGAHGFRKSIYANQKQRRQEAQAAFKKRLEQRRMHNDSNNVNASVRSEVQISDVRPTVVECEVPMSGESASNVPNSQTTAHVGLADSGYVTTRKTVLTIANADPLPFAASSAGTREKKEAPIVAINEPVSVVPRPAPAVSPVSNSSEYFTINGHHYRILNELGKGGSSQVFQVYDEERKLCLAVKRVDLRDAEHVVVVAYRNEIALLARLQKYPDRVVRMFDYEYVEDQQQLYVVMEKGDTDLASLFKSRQSDKLSDQMVAFYWLEMLKAVQVIHHEGIVHSDLKPANFLLVAGNLKLIDFGIANAVPANKTSVTRDCQMGTLNYISPEAVSCVESGNAGDPKLKVGVKSDVWSLGCILYNMVYGKTPFQDIRNPISKMTALLSRKYAIPYPPVADPQVVDVMKRCLERDPKRRASIDELLIHPCLKTFDGRRTPTGEANATDDNLRALAETISKATPRTGARLIKAAIDHVKGGAGDGHHRSFKK